MWWGVTDESQKAQTHLSKKSRTKSTKNVSYWQIALELGFWVGVDSGGGVVVHGREEQEMYSISCPVHLFSLRYFPGPWLVVRDTGNITKGAQLHLCPAAQLSPEFCLIIDRKLHDKQAEKAAQQAGPLQTGVILSLSITHTYCVKLVRFQGPHQLCMSNVQ